MLWFVIFAFVAVVALIAFRIRRDWIRPWKQLEELLAKIARGEQPRTFLLQGGALPRRIGIQLENLLEEQRRLSRQIEENSSGTAAMFAAMEDGLLVLDAERRVIVVNPAFYEVFGRTEMVLPAPLLEVVRDVILERLIARVFECGEASRGELTLSSANRGALRQFQISAVPMRNAAGSVHGAVVIFHDITELKLTDEIRRDFVANVSHELRTPLSIFRGYIETLLENPNTSPEETRRILEVMEKHSNRLRLLVEDLLSLSKLESRDAVLQCSNVQVDALLAEVVHDWRKKFEQKKLTVKLEAQQDVPPIHADDALLQEVVYNLLDNAVKYTREGGEIRVALSRENGAAALSVSDTGIGIPKTDLPRIFERFYRADKARSREMGGTGLGLSIVKHIAQLHGGSVEAESELGRGTTIRVTLPVGGPAELGAVTET